MKKLLALILSVAMVFTMGTGVMAYSDVEEGTYVSEAVTVLSDLGILNGYEDGSFKPEATVTRAEMAKIVCETLGYDNMGTNKVLFDDVDPKHWAGGYINTAYGLGIINGYGNGKFGPEDTVTYEQAVKMVVCALGYEPMAESKGGWSAGYTSVAANIGLTKGVTSSARGDIATLIYNALTTPVMEQTSYGSEPRYEILDGKGNKEYKTILTNQDIYVVTGVVTDIVEKDYVTVDFTGEFDIYEDCEILIGDTNITDYMHQEVEIYMLYNTSRREYTALSVIPADSAETFTILSDDIKEVNSNKIVYYVDSVNSSKTKTLNIDEDVEVKLNTNSATLNDIIGKEDIELMFVQNDNDNAYDVIVATEYTSAIVESVDTYREKMIIDGQTVTFDFEDEDKIYIFTDIKGNSLSLKDFDEDDVVAYVTDTKRIGAADYLKIVKLTDSVIVGMVESVDSRDKIVTIDGNDYKVTDNAWNDVNTPGAEGIFYIGVTGKIFEFDGSIINSNYGYILAVGINDNAFEETVQIKMLTEDGVAIYNLTEKMAKEYIDVNFTWNENVAVDADRFVEYATNSKGQISKLETITNISEFTDAEYKIKTEMLNGKFIDKDTLIFVLNEDKAEDTFVTDIDYLVDEATYTGATYVKNGDTKVVLITDTDAAYSSEMGFAIATNKGHTTDKDDNKVFYVKYVQNEETGVLYFEDGEVDEDDFEIGTVFMYNTLANGYVNKYSIVASINNGDFIAKNTTDLGRDVEVVFGYIYNTGRDTNSKGNELITLENEDVYVITNATNKYTYNEVGSRTKIEVGDFLAGNAYYRDGDNVTAVMLKLVDGVVVDIYTISK